MTADQLFCYALRIISPSAYGDRRNTAFGITQHPVIESSARVINPASQRVLQKCGFVIVGDDRGFANARAAETEEYLLRLEAPPTFVDHPL